MTSSADTVLHLLCDCCGDVYSNPHSLVCGHVFCLSPCILSFKSEGLYVFCRDCKRSSHVDDLVYAERIAEEVRSFKQKNKTIARSSCVNCHLNCEACELCSHCDRYLCHKCVKAHKDIYSSVLLGRLLDLKIKYSHLVKRQAELESGPSADAIRRLQAAVEGALLKAEICLQSMEILLDEVPLGNAELAPKLVDIADLLDSNKRRTSASLHSTAMFSVAEAPLYLPLSFQSFQYRKSSMKSEDSLSTSVSSQVSQLSPPPPQLPPEPSITPKPSSKMATTRKNSPDHSEISGVTPGVIYFQATPKKSKTKLPEMDEIAEYFRQFGRVTEVILRSSPPCGYVLFDTAEAAKIAVSVTDHAVKGCKFIIRTASVVSPLFRESDHKYLP